MWHSQNPPRKHFGCWFSLHSNRFLVPSSNYSEETQCLDHLTRSFSHRTPRFMKPCMVMQINTQRNTSSPHFYRWKFVWLKGVLPVLRHGKETCWVWTWKLGSASKNSALVLWKQECVILKPTWENTLGVWENTWVLNLSSLLSVLIASSWLYWWNTVLWSPYYKLCP